MSKVKTFYPALDEAIAVYLRRTGMTQAEFAKELGMSEVTLSWKRRGVNEWSMSEAVRVCNILGMTLDAAVVGAQRKTA